MAAKRRSARSKQIKTARAMECAICKVDLSAKPTMVPNPFDTDRAPSKALRAPERVEMIFSFGGFSPPRPEVRKAMCIACAGRMTFTCTGLPLMIDPEAQAIEMQGKATDAEKRASQLIAELQGVLSRFNK
ncbi:MAG: hypothetical protein WAV09_03185 [Minisyncoccia bacterium]